VSNRTLRAGDDTDCGGTSMLRCGSASRPKCLVRIVGVAERVDEPICAAFGPLVSTPFWLYD
jgi:hypothetical protein